MLKGGVVGATCALVAAALAGCGSATQLSKAQYGLHLERDVKAFESAAALLKSVNHSEGIKGELHEIDTANRMINGAVKDLASITPPADASADNTALEDGWRFVARTLERMTQDILNRKVVEVRRLISSLSPALPSARAATAAIRDLQAKGYLGSG